MSKNRRRDFSIVPVRAKDGADGTGADVPPAALNAALTLEPMEMDAPADPVVVQALAVERLRVMSNYAYYDDDGLFRAWAEGAIVTDPEEIETLTGRKAPVERIDQ